MAFSAASTLIKTNADIERDQQKTYDELRKLTEPESRTGLYNHLLDMFNQAVSFRDEMGITDRLYKCRRQRDGEYDPDKLAKIREQGRCQTFFNITDTKCSTAESWMQDVMGHPGPDTFFKLHATPVPSLPENAQREVVERVVAEFSARTAQPSTLAQDGSPAAPEPVTPPDVQQFVLDLYDKTLIEAQKQAQKCVDRMQQRIEDQLAEGDFYEALDEFIQDLCTFPLAILKGPTIRQRRHMRWDGDKIVVSVEAIPTWTCISPFDFYPSPSARTPQDSYICEVVEFDPADLSLMRGAEGWNTEALDAILNEHAAGRTPGLPGTAPKGVQERARLESHEPPDRSSAKTAVIRAVEVWGSIQGSFLSGWDIKVDDDNDFYEITAILIGEHIAYLIDNADPLKRRPYSATAYTKVRGSLYGKALPEKMRDCQENSAATNRHLIDNMAIGSGPQVVQDLDSIEAGEHPRRMFPWKIWQWHSRRASTAGKPIEFFQPDIHTGELIAAAEHFEEKADDRTLIPRYAHGNEQISGAGKTAAGLSMLMSAGARGIKRVIAHMDQDVLKTTIERIFAWNMKYLDDTSIKGDAFVVPRGVLATLVHEQTQLRLQEFLSRTLNSIDQQIMGIEGRAAALRKSAEGLDLPVEDVVPSDQELKARFEQNVQNQMPEPAPGPDMGGGAPALAGPQATARFA